MSRIEEVRLLSSWPTFPKQDDYEQAKEKARQLLKSILPEKSWREFEKSGILRIHGERGTYGISAGGQTEIKDLHSGRLIAYACLQLTIPAPTCDRVVAEYLLIKNAEDVYWTKANIFWRCPDDVVRVAVFSLSIVDILLFLNLFFEILTFK